MTNQVGRGHNYENMMILVVDDEEATRNAYVRVLTKARFRTCEAESGEVALQQLADRSVDAVVLDQQMPGMTGMELTAAIRTHTSHDRTPVLFVSGDGSAATRIRALEAGAADFMVKPVNLAELVARVEAQLRAQATWQTAVRSLSRRAEAVASLADLGAELDPAATASVLCERISQAQGGAPVGLYESRRDGAYGVLAAIGQQPSFLTSPTSTAGFTRPSQRIRSPWLEHEASPRPDGGPDLWWGCAPLRQGGEPLGVLVLGSSAPSADAGSIDQLVAAAVDYAAVTGLHLGLRLTDARSTRERRDSLNNVLTEQGFWPVFQPIIKLAEGQIVGYEALTRFRDGVAPDKRLAEAAEIGLAAKLEVAMFAAAITSSARLPGDVWLSVNVSPAVLIERNAELVALVARSTRPLVIELTEHDPIEDYDAARTALARLGPDVRLSVDDAGAGFASLRHVVDLHPQFLKLDRSWVAKIHHDESRQALVAGLVAFAARTGTDIIGEGIETEEEKAALEHLSVPLGQGYLLGRPQPLEAT
jgi:EAL domain-containing protein (putative c-di-GMP-specific phosphodiesterase class I)/FixJ family two-component response regulator